MATDGARKYIHWYNGAEEAYNLVDDSLEQINLIETMDISDLKKRCVIFEQEHGEPAYVQEGAFVDVESADPHPQAYSLFPDWSSIQFPPW